MVVMSRFVRAQQTAAPYCQRFNHDARIDPELDEFSIIDPALIEGLDGAQRKPFVNAYWAEPDLHRRLGESADTFAEFVERVRRFQDRMGTLTAIAAAVFQFWPHGPITRNGIHL
jgi:broad specificity phosphatase PhoE